MPPYRHRRRHQFPRPPPPGLTGPGARAAPTFYAGACHTRYPSGSPRRRPHPAARAAPTESAATHPYAKLPTQSHPGARLAAVLGKAVF